MISTNYYLFNHHHFPLYLKILFLCSFSLLVSFALPILYQVHPHITSLPYHTLLVFKVYVWVYFNLLQSICQLDHWLSSIYLVGSSHQNDIFRSLSWYGMNKVHFEI